MVPHPVPVIAKVFMWTTLLVMLRLIRRIFNGTPIVRKRTPRVFPLCKREMVVVLLNPRKQQNSMVSSLMCSLNPNTVGPSSG